MSDMPSIDLGSLHHAVLREAESEDVLELAPDFYRRLSEFVGNLRRQEFDGVEDKIKDEMITMATDLISLLMRLRLEKLAGSPDLHVGNLLDEEKFIIDSQRKREERAEMILNATIHGKSKFSSWSALRGEP